MTKVQREIKHKLRILNHAQLTGNVAKTCRYFGISRQSFYTWRQLYYQHGENGLINKKPCPENVSIRVAPEIEEKILYLRQNYHLGPKRIHMYIQRYHPEMKVSDSGVYWVLKRNNLNRLPRNVKRRSLTSRRYQKQIPGHHIQVDVKFLSFNSNDGKKVKRFQYTAIDDATRIRAIQIHPKHNQNTAIEFIDYVIEKFPFRIHTIRTDNGHEFQTKFHWHVEDQGINHVYIKPRTPRLNGKVERSHRTDELEFYQLLSYTDDVDLNQKLKIWENYYNFERPHFAHEGKTPYEVLYEKMKSFE